MLTRAKIRVSILLQKQTRIAIRVRRREDKQMILETILVCASIGGMIGEAVATLAGWDVAVAAATGTLAGAASGAAIGIDEMTSGTENC